jgi:hypothetical protein
VGLCTFSFTIVRLFIQIGSGSFFAHFFVFILSVYILKLDIRNRYEKN